MLCHGVRGARPSFAGKTPLVYVEDATPALSTTLEMLLFTVWWVIAVSRSAFDAVFGNWCHAILLSQSAVAAKVRQSSAHGLARDYLFHNSGHIYRPLWTYEAEKKGSRVIMYFYSTSEQFKSPEGYVPDRFEWGAMSWPHYLVFDRYQKDVLKRALGDKIQVEIVGPIWFRTSSVDLPELPSKSVAVFDVPPYRSAVHFGFTTLAELYWGHNVENQFLLDIKSALDACGAKTLYKGKRNIGSRIKKNYAALLLELSSDPNFVSADPDISPVRVISACHAVISMPFTSTALIGAELGKPTAYYDCLGILHKDDRAAHGIELLSGPEELSMWLEQVFHSGASNEATRTNLINL
jgi:polysaccharide biosynthesis PFTS motif protein